VNPVKTMYIGIKQNLDSSHKPLIIAFVVIISMTLTGGLRADQPSKAQFTGHPECNYTSGDFAVCRISFYRLLARPKLYDEKRITVTGFLAIDAGRLKLYANETAYRYDIDADSVTIDVKVEEAKKILQARNRRYIYFGGIFHYTPKETDGIHSPVGTLTDIFQYVPATDRKHDGFKYDDEILYKVGRDIGSAKK
jgi:hypothetical protein